MQKKKPTQKQQIAKNSAEVRSQITQLGQGLNQIGQLTMDNDLQIKVLARVFMVKLNEIIAALDLDVEPVLRQTYIDASEQWQALTQRPDFKDHGDAWLNGEKIPEYVPPPEKKEKSSEKTKTPLSVEPEPLQSEASP